MRTLAILLFVPAAVYAQSQTPPADQAPPAQPPAASPQAPAEPTVDETASPQLVGQVASELALTPRQAQGAAGTLFALSKTKLSAGDFAKVASAVPNMEGLLKAAPAQDFKAPALDLGKIAGGGGLGAVAGVAGTLTKMGLKPDQIVKLAPTLVKALQSNSGAEAAQLLATALK
jgi:Protein of unknown function VcgC/VcgE (DUF2780)